MTEKNGATEPNRVYVKMPKNWRVLTDEQKLQFAEHVLDLLNKGTQDTPHENT
jgi:hypothetical protein